MHIQGLQKLTLLDFPSELSCTLFAHGCNLRCPFCHNPDLVIRKPKNMIPLDRITEFLVQRAGTLDAVCLSGGEPLMDPEVTEFLRYLRGFGYKIKVDTNGFYPRRLKEIIDLGLVDYIAMDVKSSKEKYHIAAGIPEIDIAPLCESIEILKSSGIDHEFRTTAVKSLHEIEDFRRIGQWLGDVKHYYIQHFADSGDLISENMEGFTREETEVLLSAVRENIKNAEIRGI